MHHSIDPAAVPGSLNLIDALELIVDRFNQSSLPQEDPVDNEEPGFYVIAEFGIQFDSLNPQEFAEFVTEASMIFKEALCDQQEYPVMINTALSEVKSQQVATVVKDQLQFEFKVLSHAVLIPGQAFEDRGRMSTSIVANLEDVESSKLIPPT